LPGVTFHGAVPNAALPALYNENDIFINASNVDNFPGALVEAACAGLPIVTTKAGGIPDMIEDHKTGLLVELNDADGLATAVMECVENPVAARAMTRTARAWAEQFAWEKIFPQLLACYGRPGQAAAEPVLQTSKLVM
jgi:glycosyltransferase involved in cell wall biosynthesis